MDHTAAIHIKASKSDLTSCWSLDSPKNSNKVLGQNNYGLKQWWIWLN
jgi:hypothetical protein